ncbi:YbhB/YbcL family Raf kinase inhibitor-like protein [Kitasatospora sp. NBC_01539]|uniref:YbhB/YbcL family Raf kinase inhibitor-like protein n=1 Tax=Kitasatospora sp. NBC_01539 TaxID=2903577 RepID=UPI003860206A
MSVNDPFARRPGAANFTVTSTIVPEGAALRPGQMSARLPGGKDACPQPSWSGAPGGTGIFAATVHAPDAPTGFWHRAAAGIPATVAGLPESAGDDAGSGLPEGAIRLPDDARAARLLCTATPAGHGPHRYFVVAHAPDLEHIGIPAESTPAHPGFTMSGHALGRTMPTATAEPPSREPYT